MTKPYPKWCCMDCGIKYGKKTTEGVATFHLGECGVCGEMKSVTEPRDYNYPVFPNTTND